MIVDWVSSIGNHRGCISVDSCDLPKEKIKWLLDLGDEGLSGSSVCIFEGSVYLASLTESGACLRCLDLTTGAVLWENISDNTQITSLSVSNRYLTYGYVALDRRTGALVCDLRKLDVGLVESGVGVSILAKDHLIKSVEKYNFEKGYVFQNLVDGSNFKITFDGLIAFACESHLIVKSSGTVSCYLFGSSLPIWTFVLDGCSDKFMRIVASEKNVIIKFNETIFFVELNSGSMVRKIDSFELSAAVGFEVLFEKDTHLLLAGDNLVIHKSARDKSWIVVFDINESIVKSARILKCFNVMCLAGNYFFTLDDDHNPIAYDVHTLDLCWVGTPRISASKVIAGRNHVIYVFPAAGLQCYGS